VWAGFVGWISVGGGQGGALGHKSGLSGCRVYGNGFQLITGASTGVWVKFVLSQPWWGGAAGLGQSILVAGMCQGEREHTGGCTCAHRVHWTLLSGFVGPGIVV